ncbi:hypothetical protein ACFVXC_25235 [Streptomyces sp. NPDC058257]|uniref:hypothetical protein n=1 Tax=Streptomyces sp. NPDC058257 TaxID=3346409 RepID=UPI0036EFAB46
MRDIGVLRLQITGGEPLIDREFPEAYSYAYDLGIMPTISTNGSQLHKQEILETITERPPRHLSLSVMDRPRRPHPAAHGSRTHRGSRGQLGTPAVPVVGSGPARIRRRVLRSERPNLGRDRPHDPQDWKKRMGHLTHDWVAYWHNWVAYWHDRVAYWRSKTA